VLGNKWTNHCIPFSFLSLLIQVHMLYSFCGVYIITVVLVVVDDHFNIFIYFSADG